MSTHTLAGYEVTRDGRADDRERHGRTSRGAKHSDAIKAMLPAPHNKGRPLSPEQRKKISDAMKDRPWSEARRTAHGR